MYDREITPDVAMGMPPMRWWLYLYRTKRQFAANQLRAYRETASTSEDLRSILRQCPILAAVFAETQKVKGFLIERQDFMRRYRGDWYRVEPCWYDGKSWHRVFPVNGVFPADEMAQAQAAAGSPRPLETLPP